MRYVKYLVTGFILIVLSGCASLDCKPNKGTVLPGTDTAVVALYIDTNNYPQASVNTVVVRPGQKIIFIGPDKFDILFKDQRSPVDKLELQSANGIVTVEIPKDIFERDQRETQATAAAAAPKQELLYRYGIRVNGKVTDPEIAVRR